MNRVLIVDDQPHVIRVLKLNLEAEGYRVDSAANGHEALQKIAANEPDVLITDIQMPGMSGQELCQSIQANMPARKFLILVMTSTTERDQRDWVKNITHLEFLEKPLSPRKLLSRLKLYFSKESGLENPHG
jgi:CheY-like chemotaxis protein